MKSKTLIAALLLNRNIAIVCLVIGLSTAYQEVAKAQLTDCGTTACPSMVPSGCGNASPDFLATYDQQGFYKPYPASDHVKVIKINFNIFQDDLGSNNFQNSYTSGVNYDKRWLIEDCFGSINNVYGTNASPSDPVSGVVDLPGSKIQFDLGAPGHERIYFYQNSYLQSHDDLAGFRTAIENDPSRSDPYDAINIYFTMGHYQNNSSSGVGGYTVGLASFNLSTNSEIVTFGTYSNGSPNYWAMSNLIHELGHVLGLCHTYGGNCAEACSGYDFLSDVFSGSTAPQCPMTGAAPNGYPFYSATDYCVNNIMGGTQWNSYYSPLQVGRMHRNLALTHVRKYLKECVYNPTPITVSSDELWDFDIQLDRDIVVQSGSTLNLTCNVSLPDGAQIIVNSGATLIVGSTITNNCDGAWAGTINVQSGGNLILTPTANIKLKGSGSIFVESGGAMEYQPGALIDLADVYSRIIIEGDWVIKADAIFNFTGSGYLNLSPTHQLTMEANSQIRLIGQGQGNRVLRLDQAAQLSVTDKILSIREGLIDYDGDAQIKITGANAQLYIEECDMTTTNSYYYSTSTPAIDAKGLSAVLLRNINAANFGNVVNLHDFASSGADLNLRNLNFTNCFTGVVMNNVQRTLNDYGSVIVADDVCFSASNVKRLWLSGSNFSGSGNPPVSGHVPTCMIINNSVAYLSGCNIHDNGFGVNASQTQLWVQGGTAVQGNNIGIKMMGSIVPASGSTAAYFNSMLTATCARIIDNNSTAITGQDFLLNIDVELNALYSCDHRTQPNRFDGNTQIFDVCYSLVNPLPKDLSGNDYIMARGNYWNTDQNSLDGIDIMQRDFPYTSGYNVDIGYCTPQHGQIRLFTTGYLKTCKPSTCFTCSHGQYDCYQWTKDKVVKYIHDNAAAMSCQTHSTKEGHTLEEDYIEAIIPFSEEDNDETRNTFASVSGIQLTNSGAGWKDSEGNTLSGDCVQLIRVAQVLYHEPQPQERRASMDKAGDKKISEVISEKIAVAVIPNPTVGEFVIKVNNNESSNLKYRIINVLGQEVKTGNITGSER